MKPLCFSHFRLLVRELALPIEMSFFIRKNSRSFPFRLVWLDSKCRICFAGAKELLLRTFSQTTHLTSGNVSTPMGINPNDKYSSSYRLFSPFEKLIWVYSLLRDASFSSVSFWGGAASQFSDGTDEVLLLLVDLRPVFSTDNNHPVLSHLSISVKNVKEQVPLLKRNTTF